MAADGLPYRHEVNWLGLPVVATVARLLCRELTLQNEYLRVENEVLREQLKGKGGRLRFTDDLERLGIPLTHLHSSGHAYVDDLKRLVRALDPTDLVPIHTMDASGYVSIFPEATRIPDGEWWEV